MKMFQVFQILLRQLKVEIWKFSLMNNVHGATSGIQLPIPLKPAASSNPFIYRLQYFLCLTILDGNTRFKTNQIILQP